MQDNLFNDQKTLNALLRDIRRAQATNRYEDTGTGIELINAKIKIGGVFDISGSRHALVQEALDAGDSETAADLRALLTAGKLKRDYVPFGQESVPNLLPTKGLTYLLGVLLGSPTKKATWYPSAFSSNSVPGATWDANWAGPSSGPVATEIGAAQTTASARLAATFGAAADASIAMSAAVNYTVDAGVSGLAVYGGTLNSSSAFGYDVAYDGSNGHVLLAATLRASPLTGLAESDLITIAYVLSATST